MSTSEDALLQAIDWARNEAYGSDGTSALSQKRAKAIEYYLGLNTNPAPEGRSQVVDRSVYETISVILPSLVRIFANSSERICTMQPVGPDDEQTADQVTAVINHFVTQMNPWEQICADWIHDSALLCNGYAMAYWDESEQLIRERYEDQSDDQVAQLMQDKEVNVIQHTSKVDEQATADAQQAHQSMMAQWKAMASHIPPGQPMPPQPPAPQPILLHDLVIEREENEGKVCIKVLAPEHCDVGADTPDWTLEGCNYFEFRERKTIAALRAMGLEVDDEVSDDERVNDTSEDFARNRVGEQRFKTDAQGAMRQVWARMIWIRADAEGDELSRLYYVIAVGRTILWSEPVARIPVSSMTMQPLPHRHIGMSIAETVIDIQDVRTAVTRGGLDNLYLANNGRTAISSAVNLDDLLDARPGGVVRMVGDEKPADGHIMPLQHPFAFQEIIGSLEYFDQIRQNRTGATRTFAGNDPNATNDGWRKTMAVQTQAGMRIEHIARTIAPAIEALFSAVQEIISKHQNKALTIKLKGDWVTVDPQAWRTKRDVKISVGVGAGNKDSMMGQIQQMIASQTALAPMGLAGPRELYASVIELAKMAGFPAPEKFWADPSKHAPQPQQPSPDQIKAQTAIQLKTMELQADAHKFQAEMVYKMRDMQVSHEAKMREIQGQLEVQAQNDSRDAMREQQRTLLSAQAEQNKQEYERQLAIFKAEVDKYKADLDAQVKLAIANRQAAPIVDMAPVQAALDELIGHVTASTVVIRDQRGKAIGIQKGDTMRPLQRGPDGRVSGLQ